MKWFSRLFIPTHELLLAEIAEKAVYIKYTDNEMVFKNEYKNGFSIHMYKNCKAFLTFIIDNRNAEFDDSGPHIISSNLTTFLLCIAYESQLKKQKKEKSEDEIAFKKAIYEFKGSIM